MIKKAKLEFNKKELSILLNNISKVENKELYEKLEYEYLLMCHQEAIFNMIKEYYGHNFISAEYRHSDSNYNEGLLKFKVNYRSINQETYMNEIVSDIEMAKIIEDNETYKYNLLFHK